MEWEAGGERVVGWWLTVWDYEAVVKSDTHNASTLPAGSGEQHRDPVAANHPMELNKRDSVDNTTYYNILYICLNGNPEDSIQSACSV